MRKIKFRGKRVPDGRFVFGFYSHTSNTDEHYIYDGQQRYAVDPESVAQWTGLRDSKGVGIYEGDHLKHTVLKIEGQVVFCDGGFFVLSKSGARYLVSYDWTVKKTYAMKKKKEDEK